MAFSQTDLDVLDKAIAMGALEVEHPVTGKVRYRNLSEMIRTRDLIKAELAGGTTTLADNRVVTGMRSGFQIGGGTLIERLYP